VRQLRYLLLLSSIIFLFACATDSGIEGDSAATTNPSFSQPKYPAIGAGVTANPENDNATMNSNIDAMQQQNMQQQMMQRRQQKMINSPGVDMGR